jgi:uncharacterized membrane protein
MSLCKELTTQQFTIFTRIKKKYIYTQNYQTGIERTEKFVQSFGRMMTSFVSIAQPLKGTNAYSTIKHASSKRQTLPNVSQQQVTLYFPF